MSESDHDKVMRDIEKWAARLVPAIEQVDPVLKKFEADLRTHVPFGVEWEFTIYTDRAGVRWVLYLSYLSNLGVVCPAPCVYLEVHSFLNNTELKEQYSIEETPIQVKMRLVSAAHYALEHYAMYLRDVALDLTK